MQPEDRLTLGYVQAHPLEAARRLESFNAQEAATILAPLPPSDIAVVLEHCLPAPTAKILSLLSRDMAGEIITTLSASSAIGVMRQFEDSLQDELLEQLGTPIGASLRRAMRYPVNTAGSLADPKVFTLPPDVTVNEALNRLRADAKNTTYYVYVIDRDTKLEGLVTLKQLIVNEPEHLIASMMTREVITLSAEANIEEILQHPQWARFHTLPVVDRWGTFLGALRYRTLRGIEQDLVVNANPGSLSQTLIKLWEAYSLAGLRIMTDMADTAKPRSESTQAQSITGGKEGA